MTAVTSRAMSPARMYLTVQVLKAISQTKAEELARAGAIVPVLHKNRISSDILTELENYLYIPIAENERWTDTARWLTKFIPKANFQALGPTSAKQIDDLIQNCLMLTEKALAPTNPSIYRVTTGGGPLKGFFVTIKKRYDEAVEVSPIFGPNVNEVYTIPKGALVQAEDVVTPKRGQQKSVRTLAQRNHPAAFVIDGHNLLYRSAFANYKLFHTATNSFIGGAVGFYYNMYRLCRAYPEHEMHIVFDPDTTVCKMFGFDKKQSNGNGHFVDYTATTVSARREKMPEYKNNRNKLKPKFFEELSTNLIWIMHFLKNLGFPVYSHPAHEGDNIIGSVVEMLRQRPNSTTIIWSTDSDMKQLVSPNTKLYHPKTRSYDFNEIITSADVQAEYPVGTDLTRINWVRAVTGDDSDSIPSACRWIQNNYQTRELQPRDQLCRAVREAESLDEFISRQSQRSTNMNSFMHQQFNTNLDVLTIDTHIPGMKLKAHQMANEDELRGLLSRIGLHKEIEQFQERVLPALLTLS